MRCTIATLNQLVNYSPVIAIDQSQSESSQCGAADQFLVKLITTVQE